MGMSSEGMGKGPEGEKSTYEVLGRSLSVVVTRPQDGRERGDAVSLTFRSERSTSTAKEGSLASTKPSENRRVCEDACTLLSSPCRGSERPDRARRSIPRGRDGIVMNRTSRPDIRSKHDVLGARSHDTAKLGGPVHEHPDSRLARTPAGRRRPRAKHPPSRRCAPLRYNRAPLEAGGRR